jgi:hypothetical protein
VQQPAALGDLWRGQPEETDRLAEDGGGPSDDDDMAAAADIDDGSVVDVDVDEESDGAIDIVAVWSAPMLCMVYSVVTLASANVFTSGSRRWFGG